VKSADGSSPVFSPVSGARIHSLNAGAARLFPQAYIKGFFNRGFCIFVCRRTARLNIRECLLTAARSESAAPQPLKLCGSCL
jgi:hypothetical protein